LRFLTAALAGGAALLLWGGTAGAAEARTQPVPAPAATAGTAPDAGLLDSLLGEGGALTPVIDLVDATTASLTGTTPVGATVTGVAATVDPIVAPVVAPVTQAADPVLTPVLDTVGDVTTAVVGPTAGTLPTTPGTPPVVPTIDPSGPIAPELPPLLPPDPAAEPGATPGSGPTTSVGPSAVGAGAPLPVVTLGATADPSGRSRAGSDPAARSGSAAERAAAADRATADHPVLTPTSNTTDGSADHGPQGPGHRPAGPGSPAAAPAPCSGPHSGTTGTSVAVALLASPTASGRCGATSLETPAGPPPHSAPPAGPDVAPD
jgi:hypothetical protein